MPELVNLYNPATSYCFTISNATRELFPPILLRNGRRAKATSSFAINFHKPKYRYHVEISKQINR